MPRWTWIAVQNVICLLVLVLGPCFSELSQLDWPRWLLAGFSGVLLLLAGARMGLKGMGDLGVNRTPHPQPKPGGRLVTEGAYAVVRHPLYSSLIRLGWGWALVWWSSPAMLMAAALSLWLFAKAKCEEKLLLRQYSGYDAYRRRTRMF